jgi:lipase chaperone LimK
MKSPLRRLAIVGAVIAASAALIGGAVAVWPRMPAPSAPSVLAGAARHVAALPQVQIPAAPLGRRVETVRAPAANPGEIEPLPGSLNGTDVDGWLGVDDDGNLVVTPGARWFFDYFLSAAGEEPPEQMRARIVAEIERRLPSSGAHQAIALLDRYLAYRQQVRATFEPGAPDDLRRRLEQLHDLRQQTFGDADAAALFGEEEHVQAVDIQRRELRRDGTLTADERQRRLDALEQQLPDSVRAARTQAFAPAQLRQDEEQLRAADASAEELRALRQQRFGAEAADRLAALDRERAEWQQRLDDYRSARHAIDDNRSLTPQARADALAALLAERFNPEEQVRIEALDTVADRTSP